MPEPDSSRGLGQTVGRRPPIKPDCGAADRSGKKATKDARHRRSHVKLKMRDDIETNPGPRQWVCTEYHKRIKRTEWSVKCNHCSQWIHWRCTDLGDNGRWSSQFRGFCCRVVTPRSQNESRLGRRRKHRTEKRLRRLKLRDEKWVQAAKTQGKRETTTMWTWNIQRARVTFPRRDRFADILRVISRSRAEVVFLSELNEQAAAMQWVKSRELYGVLIHGKKSAIFLRAIWAVNWLDQGGKREIGTRSTAVEVDGMKLVSTYQPIWGGDLQEFQSYREELSAMCRTNRNSDLMIIGGDFNSSIGAANNRTRDETTGPFGIGKMNAAGRNLKEWCQENEFCWQNSFFQQHRR